MLDHARYIEKIHYIDAELAGHVHKLDGKLQNLCGSSFSLFAVRILAKTLSLWSKLNNNTLRRQSLGTFLYPQIKKP